MAYQIKILPSAQRNLDGLDAPIFKQVQAKITELAQEPRPMGCIKLTAQEGYRIRSGKWRVLYRIEDSQKILLVYRVKHRKEAYGKSW